VPAAATRTPTSASAETERNEPMWKDSTYVDVLAYQKKILKHLREIDSKLDLIRPESDELRARWAATPGRDQAAFTAELNDMKAEVKDVIENPTKPLSTESLERLREWKAEMVKALLNSPDPAKAVDLLVIDTSSRAEMLVGGSESDRNLRRMAEKLGEMGTRLKFDLLPGYGKREGDAYDMLTRFVTDSTGVVAVRKELEEIKLAREELIIAAYVKNFLSNKESPKSIAERVMAYEPAQRSSAISDYNKKVDAMDAPAPGKLIEATNRYLSDLLDMKGVEWFKERPQMGEMLKSAELRNATITVRQMMEMQRELLKEYARSRPEVFDAITPKAFIDEVSKIQDVEDLVIAQRKATALTIKYDGTEGKSEAARQLGGNPAYSPIFNITDFSKKEPFQGNDSMWKEAHTKMYEERIAELESQMSEKEKEKRKERLRKPGLPPDLSLLLEQSAEQTAS